MQFFFLNYIVIKITCLTFTRVRKRDNSKYRALLMVLRSIPSEYWLVSVLLLHRKSIIGGICNGNTEEFNLYTRLA